MVPKGRQSIHQKAALSLQAGPTLTRALPLRFSAKYMALTVPNQVHVHSHVLGGFS